MRHSIFSGAPATLVMAAAASVLVLACGTAKPGGMSEPTIGRLNESKMSPLESAEILRRTRTAQPVFVKHVLLGWDDLEDNYDGKMEARARARSRFDAERLVRELVGKLEKGEPIEPLIIEHSGDLGTKDARAIRVTSQSDYVPRFKAISMRLEVGEHGVVRTPFGYHIVKRVK